MQIYRTKKKNFWNEINSADAVCRLRWQAAAHLKQENFFLSVYYQLIEQNKDLNNIK
jgi:hypothetical protein